MKKTLLFLMGVCLTFFSQAGTQGPIRSEHEQCDSAFSAMVSRVKSCLKDMEKTSRLESSPTAVDRMINAQDNIVCIPAVTLKRQVSFEGDENSLKTLALCRPDDILNQSLSSSALDSSFNQNHPTPPIKPYLNRSSSSNLEITCFMRKNSSNEMFRVHSSQCANLCDDPTPPLKTPESDDMERSRSRSTSSDFYLGSLSLDSPRKPSQRQRIGMVIHQLYKTPEITEESSGK